MPAPPHDLLYGSFLTLSADNPQGVVTLAQLPSLAAFVDTWTHSRLAPVSDPFEEEHRATHLLSEVLMSRLSHLSYKETELLEPLARLCFYPGQV